MEQQVIDRGLVVESDVGEFGGNAANDVEVSDRQQVGLTLGQPGACGGTLTLGAMPVAAANGRRPLAALCANLVMGSWRAGIGHFSVNCCAPCLHNRAVLCLRRLGH